MKRREFLQGTVFAAAAAGCASVPKSSESSVPAPMSPEGAAFAHAEATISSLSAAMAAGTLTSRALCEQYLARIDALDRKGPQLHALIELNPDALAIADSLDRERKEKGPRGPLHGIPVVVKDNLDTGDKMATTAGSLALVGVPVKGDAFVVQRLRAAGAVLLGKTNLSEWANIRSSASTSGWSARGGFTLNPYALDRNPSGSSSGTGCAVSANLCVAGIGTETDGSIVSPSSIQGLVGLKPTVGLVSRAGIVPISASQDTAGPMTRTVEDAAILLGAIAGEDPEDPATRQPHARAQTDYLGFLRKDGLRGARIGVLRKPLGSNPGVVVLFDRALEDLKKQGAEVIDQLETPGTHEVDDAELEVLLVELKAGLASYLDQRRPGSPLRTLEDVIRFNRAHADTELAWFDQDLFEQAQGRGGPDSESYMKAVATCATLRRDLDALLAQHRLDAVVTLASGPAWMTDVVNGDRFTGSGSSIAAVPGYPSITIPMGQLHGLPVGLLFVGPAWSEGPLLKLAYGYEQATKHRQPPQLLPTVARG